MPQATTEDGGARLCGVLVTDIVDSTGIRTQVGDDHADAVQQEHDGMIRAVVARHGGEVGHWLGDGVLALFPSVSNAVEAAEAIQRAAARLNKRKEAIAELSLRMGVAAGDVERSPSGPSGQPIDEATELCAKASGGAVLASRRTLDLVGSRADIETSSLPGGLRSLHWRALPSVGDRLGLPRALQTEGQLPFVGRRAELEDAGRHLDAAFAGGLHVLAVRGDAGGGKTRLTAELAKLARGRGASVLFGVCSPDLSVPYAPFEQMFRHWLAHIEDAPERLGAGSAELVRLLPQLQERVTGLGEPTRSDAGTERLMLYDAIADWLGELARDEPLLLVLDSLHWADEATLRLLQHIVSTLGTSRILIAATFRSEDTRVDPLLHQLAADIGPEAVHLCELPGLAIADVEELARSVVDAATAERLSTALWTASGGNPLHLGELLRRADPIRGTLGPLPDGIRDALRFGVEKLRPGHRRVLELAAVMGVQFLATEVAELVADPDESFEALEDGQRAGLIREVDRSRLSYAFNHDLIREAVYEGIGGARLARLHERIGLAMEEKHPTRLADLARHFVGALALGQQERAKHFSALAAQRALATYANEQAEELFAGALDLVDREADPVEWCRLAIGRGEALRRMGDRRYRALLFETADLALAQGEGTLMSVALLATYRGTFSRALHVDREYVRRLHQALALIGPEPTALRARVLAMLAVESAWDVDKEVSQTCSDEAIAVAREIGDEAILTEALAHRQWTIYHPIEERLAVTDELAGLAERSQDPLMRFQVAGTEVFTRVRAGDGPGYRHATQKMRTAATEIDAPPIRWMLLIREAAAALMEARFSEAARFIEEGKTLGIATDQPDTEQQYVIQQFWLAFETQPLVAARTATSALAQIYQQTPRQVSWAPIAFRCCDLGMDDAARPIFDELLEHGLDSIPVDQMWLFNLCQLSAVAATLGDREACGELLRILEGHADEHANVVFVSVGSVARYLGLLCGSLGREADAMRWLRHAAESNQGLGAVTWAARCQLDLAELGLAQGDARSRTDAEAALRAAFEAAHRYGLPTLSARVDACAERSGIALAR